MASLYVRSSDGSDADNGSTWALAKATITGAAAIDAAGDTIFLASTHSEASATSLSIALAGTYSSPTRVISVSDTAEPADTVVKGATITATSSANIATTGSAYIEGVIFNSGSGANFTTITLASSDQNFITLKNCELNMLGTAGSGLVIGASSVTSETAYILHDCQIKFPSSTSGITVRNCDLSIMGGGLASGSSAITTFFGTLSSAVTARVANFDFSSAASTLSLITSSAPCSGRIDFINCKMPASWTGGICANAPINAKFKAVMWNCGAYSLRSEMASGTLASETTLVKAGGAVEGTTATSWKVVTRSTANELVNYFITEDITIPNDSIGSPVTVTVDILHDSLTGMTDAGIWLEVDYLDSSSTTKGTTVLGKRSNLLASPVTHASSTATWTTTGMTNPNKQKLEVTITPQKAGNIYARVCVAAASKTVYIDYSAYLA